MILRALAEAVAAGLSLEKACAEAGVQVRTVQRWRRAPLGLDRRTLGPRQAPANRLSDAEQAKVLSLLRSQEYRDLSPKQVVPQLADKGAYIASESTMYRLLRRRGELTHRGRARAPQRRPRPEHVATGPNQVWSWDITYLRGPVRGAFLYLYLVVDVYSRKIMGWSVADEESMDLAAALIRRACSDHRVDANNLVLHSDNGGPMRGSTMLATLQALGIVASFSRPRVSDDNAFSEALFRTLKYRPGYPARPFASLDDARAWVTRFVAWYNGVHRHSAIRYVTPDERHCGLDHVVLERRHAVYRRARGRNPARWSRQTRDWTPAGCVHLNRGPSPDPNQSREAQAA